MKKTIPVYIFLFIFLFSNSYALVISPQYIPYLIKNVPAVVSEVGTILYPTVVRSAAAGAVVSEVVPVVASVATTARIIACVGFASQLATWAIVIGSVGLVLKDGGFFTVGETPQSNFRPDGSYGSDVTITSKTSPSLIDCKMRFFRDYDSARAYMVANYPSYAGLSNLNGIKYYDISNNLVCCAPEFQAPFVLNGLYINYSAPNKFIAAYPAQPQDISTWNAHYSYFNPAVITSVPVSKDQVIEKIQQEVQKNPEKYKETLKEALRSPVLNDWNNINVNENINAPYASSDTTSYPAPTSYSYPGILTATDMQALGSSILHDISAAQKTHLDSLSNTDPAHYPDSITNQIKTLSPSDVNVINEPTVNIKTETQWKTDAQSELVKPDIKLNDEFTFDWPSISEKFSGQKKDLSFLDKIHDKMKSLALFNFFKKSPDNILKLDSPSSILEMSFTMPSFGVECHEFIDLADFENFFIILGNLLYTMTFFSCIAIIFL